MSQVQSFFQDIRSGVVIKFDTLWDLNEMRKNPEYAEVDEKVFKEYRQKVNEAKKSKE